MNCSHACEKEEPEPYKNIDLLIDDIEWKHAKAVELLLTGCCANAMEGAAKKKGVKMGRPFFMCKTTQIRKSLRGAGPPTFKEVTIFITPLTLGMPIFNK